MNASSYGGHFMRYIRSRHALLSIAALGAAICTPLLGCNDTTGSGMSSMSMQLTDAPGDVQHAVVVISQIYLQGDTGRVVLKSTPVTVDLTTLQSPTTATLLQNVPVPTGTYAQLRFVVTGGYIAVANGTGGSNYYVTSSGAPALPTGVTASGTLQCPSCGQSGIKVLLPNDAISVSGQQTLLVDFNVGESFGHSAGSSGQWVMHPVLKATSVAVSGSVTATILAGTGVTLPIIGTDTVRFSDFIAILTEPSGSKDTVNFSSTTTAGVYAANFPFLVPGTYSLNVVAPTNITAFATTPSIPQTISVASGASDTTAFTLTSVSP